MQERYRIQAYSRTSLVALFSMEGADQERVEFISAKPQLRYLDWYCRTLSVKTLILETKYIDWHYSNDFSSYYVRCFEQYEKHCARIHFFLEEISERDIEEIFDKGEAASVAKARYAGFSVIRPLPETVVGRTCIIPRSVDGTFLVNFKSRANIFGVDFMAPSLPFQEQDHEVGACATSAIWSLLHGTASVFDNQILTPIEITKRALSLTPIERHILPNDGLTMAQAAAVIQHIGLQSVVTSVEKVANLKSEVSAYVRGKIPVLLSLDLTPDAANPTDHHAVTVTGVGEPNGRVEREDRRSDFRLRASRIKEIFVHDDGLGPYVPYTLDGKTNTTATEWRPNGNEPRKVKPLEILIPLDSQIRVRFPEIRDGILKFHDLMREEDLHASATTFANFEWDIFITDSRDLKREFAAARDYSKSFKESILLEPFPKFVWRVIAYEKQDRRVEFVFDATALRQARQRVFINFYDRKTKQTLLKYAQGYHLGRIQNATSITKSIIRTLALPSTKSLPVATVK